MVRICCTGDPGLGCPSRSEISKMSLWIGSDINCPDGVRQMPKDRPKWFFIFASTGSPGRADTSSGCRGLFCDSGRSGICDPEPPVFFYFGTASLVYLYTSDSGRTNAHTEVRNLPCHVMRLRISSLILSVSSADHMSSVISRRQNRVVYKSRIRSVILRF